MSRGKTPFSKRRGPGGMLPTLAIAILAVAGSCAPKPPSGAEAAYPESYAKGAALRVRDGAFGPWTPGPTQAWAGLPASLAPDAAALASSDGRSAFVAVNRVGLYRVRIDPSLQKYGMDRIGTGEDFSGRSAGVLFHRGSRFFCLLYRDPIFETESPRDPPTLLVTFDSRDADPAVKPYNLPLDRDGGDLFGLFPVPRGTWLLQLRREVPKGVESVFRSYDPESGAVKPIERSEFEGNLTPLPLSSAPEALRRAAALLAPAGCPVVVSASLPDGTRAAFSFGSGNPEDAVELRGAVTEAGTALVAWNAVAAVVRSGSESSFRLPIPAEGAVYRDVVPLEGAILALWEVGVFPNIEESGAMLLPTP